jgi:hypothetical protein
LVTVSSSYRCGSLSDFLGGVLSWDRARRERGRAREPGSREETGGGGGESRGSGKNCLQSGKNRIIILSLDMTITVFLE